MRRSVSRLTVGLALTSSIALLAQDQPAFRSGVEVVTLDVRVVDKDGQFVDDVTPGELKVLEDGREQAITAFQRVHIPAPQVTSPLMATGAPGVPDATAAPASDVAANDPVPSDAQDGRIYILLLDDLHTNPSRAGDVRAQARDFVTHYLAPADRGIVLTTKGRLGGAGLTGDRGALLEAIDQFSGDPAFAARAMCESAAANPSACVAGDDRASLQNLAAVANWLAPISGRRKTLLYFTEGLSFDQATYMMGPDPTTSTSWDDTQSGDPNESPGHGRIIAQVGTASGLYTAALPFINEAEGAAGRANVAVYPLDPRRHPETQFARIVDDASAYYLLGYVPTNSKHDGTFRTIHVQINRPGLRVIARRGYTAAAGTSAKTSVPDMSRELSRLVAGSTPASGLGMRVAAPIFAGPDQNSSVEVVVDVDGRDLMAATSGKDSLALAMTITDKNGQVKASERATLDMALSARTREAVAAHGIRIMSRLAVPPGQYVLRVAGIDGQGNSQGNVQYTLDVPRFGQDDLAISSISIASSSDLDRPVTGSDNQWRERFPQPPTTRRTFAEDDSLLVFGDIYPGRHLEDVDVETTVRDARGNDIVTREQSFAAGAAGGARAFEANVPLQGLEPGAYVVSVDAHAGAASASRLIPINIR